MEAPQTERQLSIGRSGSRIYLSGNSVYQALTVVGYNSLY